MQAINPATGQVIRDYPSHTAAQVQQKVEAAQRAFTVWKEESLASRGQVLVEVAKILRQRSHQWAQLMTQEMGKPISQAESEVEKCAWVCEFYAEKAVDFLANQAVAVEGARSFVRFDPLGTVLAIMPWNFPFWQVFRFAAPALMAGNVGLLKHASNVPGTALAIEEIFRQAGLPDGAFSTLLIDNDQVAEVIKNPIVQAVTLTGSEQAGRAVAATAGEQIKKTVLELGGSDPFIVLADSHVLQAAEQAAKARTVNSGQSCIAAKRFIVESAVVEEFSQLFVQQMQQLKVGDPQKAETEVGPLAREDLRESLHDQLQRSLSAGAKLLCGGHALEGPGYFYAPTVLGQVQPGMPAFDEETFGPLAAIIEARDGAHAVELANQSEFGLGASIWTRDITHAQQLAAGIDSGCVFINEIVKSDPRVPFGGIKRSGYGRELSDFGIREFTNIKTVWVKHFDEIQEASEESFPASDPPAWTPVSSS